ncbi:putative quinol monooxygenase [Flexibacterium corallicola]|uniref:putative quinol monooxygenase n=1 Tax=Flexibacterium corallicola TaxID=3037259 RepID=UPI00286F5BD4|nr:putative quinol monooxygenase [Pseudovibrio sp. M1P-2-3]
MSSDYYVTAQVRVKSDAIQEAKDVLGALAIGSRTEAGCVSYDYFQSEDDASVFISVEQWRSVEAEEEHWNTPHLKTALESLAPLLEGEAVINKYRKFT